MTPNERRQQMEAILNHHDEIARHLRLASDAFDMLMETLQASARATHAANEASRQAIDAMIAANAAALALLNDEPS